VGVNKFADDEGPLSIPAPDYSALEREQVENVKKVRQKRNATAIDRALTALRAASAPNSINARLMPLIVDAVRSRATVGEIAETLAANWGFYRP
jgi:methylmalonyl-CoA mutase N-terminal domain/subunit